MKLLNISRGHLILEVDKRSVKIYGEAFLCGHGSPDFVLYASSIDRWDAPNDSEKISRENKAEIFEFLRSEFAFKSMTLEIE